MIDAGYEVHQMTLFDLPLAITGTGMFEKLVNRREIMPTSANNPGSPLASKFGVETKNRKMRGRQEVRAGWLRGRSTIRHT